MKVEFGQYNTLFIMPENYFESYALQKWAEDFFGEDNNKINTCLSIGVYQGADSEK